MSWRRRSADGRVFIPAPLARPWTQRLELSKYLDSDSAPHRARQECRVYAQDTWLSCVIRLLQNSDVELFHLEKRFGYARQLVSILFLHHLIHYGRNDLP